MWVCGMVGGMKIKRHILLTCVLAGFSGVELVNSAVAGPNCTCRFAGQNFKTGDVMCIRGKLSRCEFVLNNTSWKTIAQTCPQVELGPNQSISPVLQTPTLMARLRTRLQF